MEAIMPISQKIDDFIDFIKSFDEKDLKNLCLQLHEKTSQIKGAKKHPFSLRLTQLRDAKSKSHMLEAIRNIYTAWVKISMHNISKAFEEEGIPFHKSTSTTIENSILQNFDDILSASLQAEIVQKTAS